MSRTVCRGFSAAAEVVTCVTKGRFQSWRKPVYHAPHINPLEVGPDFSFPDGRPVQFTSVTQLENRKEQLRLANKIVDLLSEVHQMEKVHAAAKAQRLSGSQEQERWRPSPKGEESLI